MNKKLHFIQTCYMEEDMQESKISTEEISAICSNLAKGCEKQRLIPEMEAFNTLAAFYKHRAAYEKDAEHLGDAAHLDKAANLKAAAERLAQDLEREFLSAKKSAEENADRGALRSLVWSEKVSAMMKSILDRFMEEGEAMLAYSSIYVCDICGFIYLGDSLPEICPVCKVPNYKMTQIERS